MTPDTHTIQETFIEVGDGHTLYLQEWGNKKGMPVIFLHGGPGSGCRDGHKNLFDPAKHRVIFFDQRGSGRSAPAGSVEHNTTADLVGDIEKIADHYQLSSFALVGGSWGSCLALAYGVAHPKRVSAMVLYAIFTGSQSEIAYFNRGGFADFYPDVWQTFIDSTPKQFQDNPLVYHFKRMASDDQQAAKQSAYACHNMESALMNLDDRFIPQPFDEFEAGSTSIEGHYLAQGCFIPDRYILEHTSVLTMHVWLVQGRYDMVCPPRTAYELSKKLPSGELTWTISGHRSERETWNICRSLLVQLAKEKVG